MNFANYRDFYQKSLLPIGSRDQSILNENMKDQSLTELPTHWLIALEGECHPKPKEYYYWKVSIYPSNSVGSFHWKHAYYSSPSLDSLDQAMNLARTFESYIIKDELHSASLCEKIG